MVWAGLSCSFWLPALLRRLLQILTMRGVQPCTWRGEGGAMTCCDLAGLEADRMLQAVFHKWSTFEESVLEAAFSDCTGVYLQIQWVGWYSRPVSELSRDDFVKRLLCARGPSNLTVNS